MRAACVPLPDPWGPKIRMLSDNALLQEALVGAHHHLRLHLAHRVERDADHDQRDVPPRKFVVDDEKSKNWMRNVGTTATSAR